MDEDAFFSSPLGDSVGDLTEFLAEKRRHLLPRYELPTDPPVETIAALVDRVAAHKQAVVTGAVGSSTALVVRALVAKGRRVLALAADADAAAKLRDDVRFVLGAAAAPGVLSLLHNDTSPYADVNPDRRAAQLRLATLAHLSRGLPYSVIVTAIGALARLVPPPETLDELGELVQVNGEIDRDMFVTRLVEAGYNRAPVVEDPGSVAVRGSLVDAWSPASDRPVRIELLGDGVVSIKEFDAQTQRTARELKEVYFCPAREAPLNADSVALARDRVRALCDAANVPSAQARALVEDVASGRSFYGSDAFLPAFVDPAPLSAYLRDDLVVVMEDTPSLSRALAEELERAETNIEIDATATAAKRVRFPLASFYRSAEQVVADLQARPKIALERSTRLGSQDLAAVDPTQPASNVNALEALGLATTEATPTLFTFDQSSLVQAMRPAGARAKESRHAALEPLCDSLENWRELGFRVGISARTQTQLDRIVQLLSHRGVPLSPAPAQAPDPLAELLAPTSAPTIRVIQGDLARGLVAPAERFVLLTEEEIFGARAARSRNRPRVAQRGSRDRSRNGDSASARNAAFALDMSTLSLGDLVVHVEHGIGRYRGLVHRDVGTTRVDLLVVEYNGGDKLYLPVYRLNQIQQYSGGGEGVSPKLDRLGGQTFAKTKARAAREVRKMADELLKLYAERRAVVRESFATPDDEYRAFEATFPFEETTDQARAIADVEHDLERPGPMDRLVCGDVGFGKTEVAIRAAFRVAASGRQVAILCPTTVLAYQHFLGFEARMHDYAITVKSMSRFQTKAEQDEVLKGLKSGAVDIVIGTHRLLSKDVFFKKLGLLVVDEEQRFGVTHKERIKQMKTSVDILTLSATPIPRTLQMAISGIRDMSVITTPPIDRRAIRTLVSRPDPAVIKDAIERELERGGQVFYVYNRVEGLYERAARLAQLVPRARIAVAHGQLAEHALEQAMLDFVEGRFDVLCATAIVESGLDIPRANTMIIDRADMFGLAQLYQLRGRVGRSRERAYCYLVVPPQEQLSDEARTRIEAIERHTELGSGFQVASLDLELRGGGDLLGAEQSGTVGAVGFELFCQLLDQAVHELRGENVVPDIDPELSVDEEALLPEEYVEDVGVRLALYKRLASAMGEGEVDEIASEMEDRFGNPPESALRLIRLMRLKTELRKIRALGCEATARTVTLHLADDTPLDIRKILALVQAKKSPYKVTPDKRIIRRISEDEAIKGGLDAADLVLTELARCA